MSVRRAPRAARPGHDDGPQASSAAWDPLRELLGDVVRATETLGTDLDTLLLWGVLACESLAPRREAGASAATVPDANARRRANRGGRHPVRIRDLSRLTGIPRETVRRKLLALEAAGRVEQVVQGWVVGPAGDASILLGLAEVAVRRFDARRQVDPDRDDRGDSPDRRGA